MGLVWDLIYLDSCLAIYLVEETAPFSAQLEEVLAKNANGIFCVSPLIAPQIVKNILIT